MRQFDNLIACIAGAHVSGAPPWAPSDLANKLAWVDMQDVTAYSNISGGIASVTNKFSGVIWSEATNRPAFLATGLNGRPTINANGVGDRITFTEAAVLNGLADQKDYYGAMVVEADDLDAIEVIFSVGRSDQAGASCKRWGTNTTSTGRWTAIGTPDTGSGIVADSTAAVTNGPTIFEAKCVSGITYLRISVVGTPGTWTAGTATAYGALTPNQGALFGRASQTFSTPFDGRLSELIFCGLTSDANQDNTRAYLTTKWGF